MKKLLIIVLLMSFVFSLHSRVNNNNPELRAGFVLGDVNIQSINSLAFGPDGILFIGDSESAKVYAIDTKDNVASSAGDIEIKNIDIKIAEKLGTDVNAFTIRDMVVNPLSKNIYFAIHVDDGTPVLLKLEDDKIVGISFNSVWHSSVEIEKAPDIDAKDTRGRGLRKWTISDMNYSDGRIMLSGLSNREFSSTFSAIEFPFKSKEQSAATLEIYHAAHGRYETYAPIKTFTTAILNGSPHMIASYTCTPLVVFPIENLKSGNHVKGRTVAELGNRNTPLDIISVEHEGNSYILMSNTSRALMKISYKDLESFQGTLNQKISERSGTAGAHFISLPLVNILQLDNYDNDKILMLQRKSNGDLDLYSSKINRWM